MLRKIKRQKKRSLKKAGKKPFNFQNFLAKRDKKHTSQVAKSVNSLPQFLVKYSVEDILTSLFVSSCWLQNSASPLKHLFVVAMLTSISPDNFSSDNKLTSYSEFNDFLGKLILLMPDFPMAEDYIPEPDWGEVKYNYNDENFKIFYGNELSYPYEYLTLFQFIHNPIEDNYLEVFERSPMDEFACCLKLQHEVISGLPNKPDQKLMASIGPGHIEIPPKSFWEKSSEFYLSFHPEKIFDNKFLTNYCVKFSEEKKEDGDGESAKYYDAQYLSEKVGGLFINYNDRFYLLFPRRATPLIFETWASLYEEIYKKEMIDASKFTIKIGASLNNYIKKRIDKKKVFSCFSAVKKDGKPDDIIFPVCFLSKNRLIICYVLSPFFDTKINEKELEGINSSLQASVKLLSQSPVTLALYLKKQNVEFQPDQMGDNLTIELFILIPQVTSWFSSVVIPKDLPGRLVFLDQFLGIIDELDEADDLAGFLEYHDSNNDKYHPMTELLASFASYKDSMGVLIAGASEPDFIALDPHSGTHLRYKTLKDFWRIFPAEGYFDDPRSWHLIRETDTRTRLEARGYFGSAIRCVIGSVDCFLTSPFQELSYEQGRLSNFLMECIEDTISKHAEILKNHLFFSNFSQINILIFPVSLVEKDTHFSHLKHLVTNKNLCEVDSCKLEPNVFGIRFVFDDKKIYEAFSASKDNSIAINLLKEILNQLDNVYPDKKLKIICKLLEKSIPLPPRFTFFSAEKTACFPELVSAVKPELSDFKKARKRIAYLIKNIGITEGDYELEDAKEKINLIRDAIIADINDEVNKFSFKHSVSYLISRIDALANDYQREKVKVKHGLNHDIDYKPDESLSESHVDYLKHNKNYRYLIEKFVQLSPQGKDFMNGGSFRELIALVDWLFVFYLASDSLHYGIHSIGMKINSEFLPEVKYEEGLSDKENKLAKESAKIELGILTKSVNLESGFGVYENFYSDLNQAFKEDLEFSVQNFVDVLQIFTYWPNYAAGTDENSFYSASLKEIHDVCLNCIEKVNSEELYKIIDFLTLKQDDVIRLLGVDEPCNDLPVWEHRKRFSRYTIRPLLMIDSAYYWGAYSTRMVRLIWSSRIVDGALPTDLQSGNISRVLEKQKNFNSKKIVETAFNFISNYTTFIERDVFLHKRAPELDPPLDLGDYDILVFLEEKDLVLNIECKDILPPFCLKDAKRLREKVFGREGRNGGHLKQIRKRQNYLENNLEAVSSILGWNLSSSSKTKIIPIHLSTRLDWFTSFPPKDVEVLFLAIPQLPKYFESLFS